MAYVTARVSPGESGFPEFGDSLYLRYVTRDDGHHWYEARERPFLDPEDSELLYGPLKGTDRTTRFAAGTGRVVPLRGEEAYSELSGNRRLMRLQVEGSVRALLEASQFKVPATANRP